MIKIAAVGDIMPGGILAGIFDGFVSNEILQLLSHADLRVGTLETAVGNEPSFSKEKMSRKADVIYTKDADLIKLRKLSIDIVSLANNHFFDLGPDGAEHCIKLLDELGVKHVGAGNNIESAKKPVVETINGKTVAFIAFCDWRDDTVGYCPFATNDSPGVNPMYDDYVVSEIKKNKIVYDYVVVLPHWGREHSWLTTQHVFRMSKLMRRAGADLILGSHPHRVQPVVNYKHSSVAFSMGNFLFPDRLIITPRSTYYSDAIIDIDSLPTTYGYPFVDELTYKKWKPLARVGMIVMSSLQNEKCYSDYSLVQINQKGFLSLLEKSSKIKRILSVRGSLLRYFPYVTYYYFERYLKAMIRRIMKWLTFKQK